MVVPTTTVPGPMPPEARLMISPNANTPHSRAITVSASNSRRVHCSR
ncbi:hypothetical protein [Thermocatellispora tengchongensis]